jgi:hypothetical protein
MGGAPSLDAAADAVGASSTITDLPAPAMLRGGQASEARPDDDVVDLGRAGLSPPALAVRVLVVLAGVGRRGNRRADPVAMLAPRKPRSGLSLPLMLPT